MNNHCLCNYNLSIKQEDINEDQSLVHHHGHDDESSDSSVPPSPAKPALDTTNTAPAAGGDATSSIPISPFVDKFKNTKLQD